MSPTARQDWEIEDEDDDESASSRDSCDWSPTKALARGAGATVLVAGLLAAGWSALANQRPDLVVFYKHDDAQVTFILILMTALCGFIGIWLLFATMHRVSQIVGALPTVVVTALMIIVILAKQSALAANGGRIPEVPYTGWDWLQPAVFLKSNIGVWMGIFAGVWIMRDGDSPLEILR